MNFSSMPCSDEMFAVVVDLAHFEDLLSCIEFHLKYRVESMLVLGHAKGLYAGNNLSSATHCTETGSTENLSTVNLNSVNPNRKSNEGRKG